MTEHHSGPIDLHQVADDPDRRRAMKKSELFSAFRRGGGDRNFAGLRLVAHARSPLVIVVLVAVAVLVALVTITLLKTPALVALRVLLLWGLPGGLPLLLRLVHRIQDTEVMFRVLEEGFGGHPVPTAGSIPAELEVFFKKLLGGTTDTDFRPIAIENVVAI
jgi:hypothetical protein